MIKQRTVNVVPVYIKHMPSFMTDSFVLELHDARHKIRVHLNTAHIRQFASRLHDQLDQIQTRVDSQRAALRGEGRSLAHPPI